MPRTFRCVLFVFCWFPDTYGTNPTRHGLVQRTLLDSPDGGLVVSRTQPFGRFDAPFPTEPGYPSCWFPASWLIPACAVPGLNPGHYRLYHRKHRSPYEDYGCYPTGRVPIPRLVPADMPRLCHYRTFRTPVQLAFRPVGWTLPKRFPPPRKEHSHL